MALSFMTLSYITREPTFNDAPAKRRLTQKSRASLPRRSVLLAPGRFTVFGHWSSRHAVLLQSRLHLPQMRTKVSGLTSVRIADEAISTPFSIHLLSSAKVTYLCRAGVRTVISDPKKVSYESTRYVNCLSTQLVSRSQTNKFVYFLT
jgi:hypothetical protein